MNRKKAAIESNMINIFHSISSLFEKRAAIEWTVGKLMSIVLLMIVLALVVYGVSVNGLNPLIDRAGNMYDEVSALILNLFGKGSQGGSCYTEKIESLSGGKDFLNLLEIDGDERGELELNVCNKVCNVSGGSIGDYSYSYESGYFENNVDNEWLIFELLLNGDLEKDKFYNELYNSALDILEESEFAKDFYESFNSDKFVLYGALDGSKKPHIVAVWQNDNWLVINSVPNNEMKLIADNEEAIDFFVENVWKSFGSDSTVYYSEFFSPTTSEYDLDNINLDVIPKKEIGKIVGDHGGLFGSYDKIDDETEVANLKLYFYDKRKEYLSDIKIVKDLAKEDLENILKDKEVLVGEKTFSFGIDESTEVPMITLFSGEEIYGLEFIDIYSEGRNYFSKIDEDGNKESVRKVLFRDQPLALVRLENDKWVHVSNPSDYRLKKEDFEEAYEGTIVYRFLISKCR